MALREISPGYFYEEDGEWHAGREKYEAYKRREVELCALNRIRHAAHGGKVLKQHETLFSQHTWNLTDSLRASIRGHNV